MYTKKPIVNIPIKFLEVILNCYEYESPLKVSYKKAT